MFISGEMVFQITLAALRKNDSVFLMKLFKLNVTSLYNYNIAIHSNI